MQSQDATSIATDTEAQSAAGHERENDDGGGGGGDDGGGGGGGDDVLTQSQSSKYRCQMGAIEPPICRKTIKLIMTTHSARVLQQR